MPKVIRYMFFMKC